MNFKRFAITFLTFCLIFSSVTAKKKKPLFPQEILDKVAATEETTTSWYICEHKKKVIKNTVIGPLETEEAVYSAWIYLNPEPKKKHCIARNMTFRTDNPQAFKQALYNSLLDEANQYGKEKLIAHYILGKPFVEEKPAEVQPAPAEKSETTAETKTAVTEPKTEQKTDVSSKADSVTPQLPVWIETEPEVNTKAEIKKETEENKVPEADTNTEAFTEEPEDNVETSSVDYTKMQELIPGEVKQSSRISYEEFLKLTGTELSKAVDYNSLKEKSTEVLTEKPAQIEEPKKPDSNFVLSTPEPKKSSDYTGYEKEYLQDYAPKKNLVLPQYVQEEEALVENPDEADNDGKTLLMKAVMDSDYSKVKLLIKSGANLNLADKDGWTALMYAARYQTNVFIVQELIAAGGDIKIINNYGISALYLSSGYGLSSDILAEILKSYTPQEKEVLKSFVLLLSDNSCTEELKIQKIECFINKNIRLNNFYNGKTPLQYACLYGNSTNIINLLISRGCDINIRSTEGKTAFDYAWENKALQHDDNFWKLNQN